MEELIKDLLKYFKPERFPIVVIIAYILLAIILNNSHPYKKQQDKIEILKSLQSVSKDTTLTKQINNDYLKILLSLDQPKEIKLIMFLWYFLFSVAVCILITIGGFLHSQFTWVSFWEYLMSLFYIAVPVGILSFLFNYYIIDNDFVTLGITPVFTFVMFRLYSVNTQARNTNNQNNPPAQE